jgi:hypothetical protein
VVVWQRVDFVPSLVDSHPGTAGIIMFLIILTAGLISAYVTVKGFEGHFEEWYDYLRLAFAKEPIGHRYLRSLVLRMKFELAMTIASIPFALGAFAIKMPCVSRTALVLIAAVGFFARRRNRANYSRSVYRTPPDAI